MGRDGPRAAVGEAWLSGLVRCGVCSPPRPPYRRYRRYPSLMLRSVILAAARSPRAERLVGTMPLIRGVVARYLAGEDTATALVATRAAVAEGLAVTLDLLVEEAKTPETAATTLRAYEELLDGLSDLELTPAAEITVSLAALGFHHDRGRAFELARAVCAKASEAGTTITLDAEDHTATDLVLETLDRLRVDFPTTGVVVQSCLRRTETDCRDLAAAGSRVRLCKRIYAEPEAVAFQSRLDIDRSFVRCLNILMAGNAYSMVATHDPRLIAIAEDRSKWFDRSQDQFEFQMLRGLCHQEQLRLISQGYTVRVYLPFGEKWYSCLIQRFADRQNRIDSVIRLWRSRV